MTCSCERKDCCSTVSNKPVYYSEVFHSLQGEGRYTGVRTAWVRYFLCNLQCDGFGQIDPTNPDTYDMPYLDFDVSSVERVEDLPVWEKGCDSSYTWSKKYRHLMGKKTPQELADEVLEKCGRFHMGGQTAHMCFTGGEPLMKHAQPHSVAMLQHFINDDNMPESVTYETNGTQLLTPEFLAWWTAPQPRPELFFSVSPKLFTVSGEKSDKAIKPEIVANYARLSSEGQLKFVLGNEDRQWEEMEEHLAAFRAAGVNWPVYIMPMGATEEEQVSGAKEVAEKALSKGYNVSARVHVYLFGNQIGT